MFLSSGVGGGATLVDYRSHRGHGSEGDAFLALAHAGAAMCYHLRRSWSLRPANTSAKHVLSGYSAPVYDTPGRGSAAIAAIVLLSGSVDGAARSTRSGVWVVSPGAPHIQCPSGTKCLPGCEVVFSS